MTVSQNTDLFVLGLVPRGVAFYGEAVCALYASVFLAVIAPENGFYRLSLGESMDEQFIQAHAQCMTHPKKPAGKPPADSVSTKRCMASIFNGVWAKPIPLRFLRNLWRASASVDGHPMTSARMGSTALIHTL